MASFELPKKIAVVGIGNLLLKDEGIGVQVAQRLQEFPLSTDVDLEIIDGATSPDVFWQLHGVDKLIIIDAARGDGEPGTIYRIPLESLPLEKNTTSLHQMDLVQTLQIMAYLGQRPREIIILGVEPKEMDCGLELSPELEKKVPQIISLILQEIGWRNN